jgi:hypothetical protein
MKFIRNKYFIFFFTYIIWFIFGFFIIFIIKPNDWVLPFFFGEKGLNCIRGNVYDATHYEYSTRERSGRRGPYYNVYYPTVSFILDANLNKIFYHNIRVSSREKDFPNNESIAFKHVTDIDDKLKKSENVKVCYAKKFVETKENHVYSLYIDDEQIVDYKEDLYFDRKFAFFGVLLLLFVFFLNSVTKKGVSLFKRH